MSTWREELIDVAPGVKLETAFKGDPSNGTRLALIAHPLGRLGGTYNDHVVRALAKRLLENHGYSVVLINSRGVGNSQGWASFSGISEAEDYEAIARHFLDRCKATEEVLLCGYSAGSLSTSYCEPPSSIKTRYLLVSYPLSALWALTLFRTSPFTSRLQRIVHNSETPLLSIRGDSDQFTADSKYARWESDLSRIGENNAFVKVDGADHFWSGKDKLESMLDTVSAWLETSKDI